MKEEIKEKYNQYVVAKNPQTKFFPSLLFAFLVGGIICCVGQGAFDIINAISPDLSQEDLSAMSLVFMIFLGTFLTALGLYDKIGAFAGAGSIIPITGFANSIASPAIEFKTEGWIFGMCVKMFTIAGPVIVNGVVGSIAVGLIYLLFGI